MTSNKADQSRGVFVSFEGGEGAGKTTHIRFLAETLEARGFEVVRLREPGGTAIGDKLRSIVLDPGNAAMCDAASFLCTKRHARKSLKRSLSRRSIAGPWFCAIVSSIPRRRIRRTVVGSMPIS